MDKNLCPKRADELGPSSGLDVAALLKRWSGGRVQVVRYESTHRRLVFRVEKEDSATHLRVAAIGCRRMSGEFVFVSSSLELSEEADRELELPVFTFTDVAAGFQLVCEGVAGVEETEQEAAARAESDESERIG